MFGWVQVGAGYFRRYYWIGVDSIRMSGMFVYHDMDDYFGKRFSAAVLFLFCFTARSPLSGPMKTSIEFVISSENFDKPCGKRVKE